MSDLDTKQLESAEVLTYQYLSEALFNAIPIDTIKDIEEWNRKAGVLSKFDPVLERTMLAEELSEGLLSRNIVDKLDAVGDYLFVRAGTCLKWIHSTKSKEDFLSTLSPTFLKFKTFLTIVSDEIDNLLPNVKKSEVIDGVLRIILEANKQKLDGIKLTKEGKVKKPEGFVPPEEKIRDYLVSLGAELDTDEPDSNE